MPKKPENHGKPWTDKQVQQLEKLVHQNTPTRVIGFKLGRTEDAIRSKASEEDISAKADKPITLQPAQKMRR